MSNEPEGDFTVITEPQRNDPLQSLINMLQRASGARHSAIAQAHRESVQMLARLYVPHLSVNPSPQQFRDLADFIVNWARIADRVLKIIGQEAKANSTSGVNLGLFLNQFQATVEGYATAELEGAAVTVEEEYEVFDGYDPDYEYEDRRASE